MERLVARQLVLRESILIETLLVEAHIPVGELLIHKLLHGTSGTGGFVVIERGHDLLDEAVELAHEPAVHDAALGIGYEGFLVAPLVAIGVGSKDAAVGLVYLQEETGRDTLHTLGVEGEVVPGSRIGHHVPAYGVNTEVLDALEGVDDIAQTLGHLDPILVQHETVADDRLESYAVKDHGGNGMEREEPATRLIDTLGNEVRGIALAGIKFLLVLEGIVYLGVGHGTRVKPHVDEVQLAGEHVTLAAYQLDVIHIGTVQVNAVVVLLTHVTGHETLVLEGIARHDTGGHGLLYLLVEFGHAAYADFLLRLTVAPDGQGGTPIT